MKKTAGRLLAAVLITALVFGGIYAGLRSYRSTSVKPVKVVPVDSVLYPADYFMEEGQQAYGSVSLDRMQTVYVSRTQNVKEVLVKEGQEVKRGDVLLNYDTTLTSIQIEKAENEVLQLKLSLERAEEDVRRAESLSPSSGGDDYDSSEPEEKEEKEKKSKKKKTAKPKSEETPVRIGGSGTKNDPYIYLWGKKDSLTNEEMLLMFLPNDTEEGSDEGETATEAVGFILRGLGILPLDVFGDETADVEEGVVTEEGLDESEETDSDSEVTDGTGEVEEADEEPDEGTSVEEGQEEASADNGDDSGDGDAEQGIESGSSEDGEEDSETQPVETPETSASYVDLTGCPHEVWVVLETHEYDNRDEAVLQRFGLHLIRDEQDVACMLFDPDGSAGDADDTELDDDVGFDEDDEDSLDVLEDDDEEDAVDYDDGGEDAVGDDEDAVSISRYESDVDLDASYTKEEIEEIRKTKAKELRDLTIDLKMAELNLKEMKAEAGDGSVRAKLNGVVKTVRDPSEAYQNNEPVVTVSGGGGYTVSISISELEYENISIGQEVDITSFDNEDAEITGSIKSISDYPSRASDNWWGGNPNVSYYPCVVYIDGDAELKEYDYVSVKYGSGTVDDSVYIEKMFVRSDASGHYVYAADEAGILRKKYISTGRQPDSSVIEIRGGISDDDYIAFPYGTSVFDGAKTQTASIDELYG
ncbi:MAG: biotin/lipoyl-binding protein [Lachnospiraceae bacterium]|nr:biotin/lipoyl-binding protein [Lachnospiraceae bacterium]